MNGKCFFKNACLSAVPMVVLFLAVFAFAAKNTVTITGMIEANELDDQGNVKTVGIGAVTDDGDYNYYYIVNKAKGAELVARVGENVQIVGVVGKDADDNATLTVNKYTIVKEEVQEEAPSGASDDVEY